MGNGPCRFPAWTQRPGAPELPQGGHRWSRRGWPCRSPARAWGCCSPPEQGPRLPSARAQGLEQPPSPEWGPLLRGGVPFSKVGCAPSPPWWHRAEQGAAPTPYARPWAPEAAGTWQALNWRLAGAALPCPPARRAASLLGPPAAAGAGPQAVGLVQVVGPRGPLLPLTPGAVSAAAGRGARTESGQVYVVFPSPDNT